MSFGVTRSDNGLPMASARLASVVTVGGKPATHKHSYASSGMARITVSVPAGSKGKQLRIKVTITRGTKVSTRAATYTIK